METQEINVPANVPEKKYSLIKRIFSLVFFSAMMFCLYVSYFFLRDLSTFGFDDTALFYGSGLYILAIGMLFIIPSFSIIYSLIKDRSIFYIKISIWLLVILFGFSNSYSLINGSWLSYCMGQGGTPRGVNKTSLSTFYRNYCTQHEVSKGAILKISFKNFLSIGGAKQNTLFDENEHGLPSMDILPYIQEAQKEESEYLKNNSVPLSLTCGYRLLDDVYSKNEHVYRNPLVSSEGDPLSLNSTASSKDSDFKKDCSDLLFNSKFTIKNIPEMSGSFDEFNNCGYELYSERDKKNRLVNFGVAFEKKTSCPKDLNLDMSKAIVTSYRLEGLPQNYFDELGIANNVKYK